MKFLFYIFISVLVLLLIYYILVEVSLGIEHYNAEVMIRKIEVFRTNMNRLPTNTTEIGYTNEIEESPFYRRLSISNYEVFYALGFEKMKIYSSKDKSWRETY